MADDAFRFQARHRSGFGDVKTTCWLALLTLGLAMGASRSPRAGESEPKSGESPTLEARLMPLIKAHKGKVAVMVKHLASGETFCYHANDVMPTASLIKLPVMVEAYRQAADKKIDLDQVVTLKKEDKVPGSGVLTPHLTLVITENLDGFSFKLWQRKELWRSVCRWTLWVALDVTRCNPISTSNLCCMHASFQ